MWKQSKSHQSGFTLVELAIVLVIIGLILAAVLKGQEMIQNAKVKNVVNDLKSVSVAYYAYQDRYKAIPGDDANAASHFTGGDGGDGDGAITGLYTAKAVPAVAAESNNFWQHTRMAGFMTGIATDAEANPPTNAVGGLLGIQGSVAANVYAMKGTFACVGSVPWKIALAADTLLDDGDSDTGSVRAGLSGAANLPTAATVSGAYGPTVVPTATIEEGMHTVCMKI